MAKKSDEEIQKHTLNLFRGDYARLQEIYPNLGAGVVIRNLVRKFLDSKLPKSEQEMEAEIGEL